MAQPTIGNIAGFDFAQFWLTDQDGTSRGTSATTLAAGATSHALKTIGPKTFGLPAPTRNVTNFQGGNKLLGSYQWGVSEIGQFTIDFSDHDADLQALVSGSSVDATTNTEWLIGSPNYNAAILPQVGMMLSTIYQSRESGSDGGTYYINYIIPRSQVGPVMSGMDFQAEDVTSYQCQPTFSDVLPTGESISDYNMDLGDDRALLVWFVTDYPLALTSFTHDGAATTFTTAYQPINTTVTVNATKNYYVEDGTTEALSSIVVASGLATVDAFATTGTKSTLLYETQFKAVT